MFLSHLTCSYHEPKEIDEEKMLPLESDANKQRIERNTQKFNDYISSSVNRFTVLPKLPLLPPPLNDNTYMSLSRTPSTSHSSLSMSSPKIVITESPLLLSCVSDYSNNSDSILASTSEGSISSGSKNDYIASLTRMDTNSREKFIFVPYGEYGDDVMNMNRRSFDDVNFCFHCDGDEIPQAKKKRERGNTMTSPSLVSLSDPDNKNPAVLPETAWHNNNHQPNGRRPRSTSSIGSIGRDELKSQIVKTGTKMRDGLFTVSVYRQVFLCTPCYNTLLKERMHNPHFILKITRRALSYF